MLPPIALQVVYRLCSIWFKLWNDSSVNGTLGDVFASTPSSKFVPLVYQIASRLDSTETQFQVRCLRAAFTAQICKH